MYNSTDETVREVTAHIGNAGKTLTAAQSTGRVDLQHLSFWGIGAHVLVAI
jgi:hypothetical protein